VRRIRARVSRTSRADAYASGFCGHDRALREFRTVKRQHCDAKRGLIHVTYVHEANDSGLRAAERHREFAEIPVQGDDDLPIGESVENSG
jgi:hypothetical protein